jgi:hypothetical protein
MGAGAGLGVVVGHHFQHRLEFERENPGNRPIGEGVGLAHETRADDADANLSHCLPHAWFALWQTIAHLTALPVLLGLPRILERTP